MKNKLLKVLALITRKFHPRGIERILRLIYDPDKRSKDYLETVIPYDSGLKINIATNSYIEWQIFFKGLYEESIIEDIKKYFKKDGVVIDVGANIGAITLIASKLVGDTGRVFAFEPSPKIFQRLNENIKINSLQNIICEKIGLSDHPGAAIFYMPNESEAQKGIASIFKGHSTSLTEKDSITLSTIDEYSSLKKVERLDFIKIDTEGNDFKVILGGSATIHKFKPVILFEYSKKDWEFAGDTIYDAISFFADTNYSVTGLLSNKEIKDCVQLDFENFLAIPSSRDFG